MENIHVLESFLYSCFQNSKIGHLVKGIVHNLNGPIQILSMQIEILKMDIIKDMKSIESTLAISLPDNAVQNLKGLSDNMHRSMERLSQMDEALSRMENMVNVITNRSQDREDAQRPLILNQVLEQELEFWNADLFFKHQVEKKLVLPDIPTLIVMNEGYLRDMIDGLLDACIKQLQETKEHELKIILRQEDESEWFLEFEHTGKPFPSQRDQDINRYPLKLNESHNAPDSIFMALNLASARAEQMGGALKIEPQKASCMIPNKK